MVVGLLALVVFVLSVVAGLVPRQLARRVHESTLADLTGVASGLLLASALLVVIPEGFHVAAGEGEGGDPFVVEPVMLGAAILAGFALMLLLEGLGVGHAVHEEHHDHLEGHGHRHVHHPPNLSVLATGLSVHAAADGLAIGAAAASGDETFSALVALAVLLHRLPAAFSLGLFTHHEAVSTARATVVIAGFAAATPVALLVAEALLSDAEHRVVALAMLFSAGTFVYVATVDTLPAIHNPDTGPRSVRNVVLGALLFAVIFLAVDSVGLLEHQH